MSTRRLVIKCKSDSACESDKLEVIVGTNGKIVISSSEGGSVSDVLINKDDAVKIIEFLME